MQHHIDWLVLSDDLGRLAIAAVLGALLGLERELAGKPAGLRTHVLVALGATLLVLVGPDAIAEYADDGTNGSVRTDPIRIVQAIVVGISFLGAGTIVHERGARVEGLTTAASILLTAGIGIAVAVERAMLAASLAVFVTAILSLLGWVEFRLGWTDHSRSPGGKDGASGSRVPGSDRARAGST